VLTEPIQNMIAVIREVKKGRLDQRMTVESTDELGELALAFNKMISMLGRNREMEASLAQQGKMASLGLPAPPTKSTTPSAISWAMPSTWIRPRRRRNLPNGWRSLSNRPNAAAASLKGCSISPGARHRDRKSSHPTA